MGAKTIARITALLVAILAQAKAQEPFRNPTFYVSAGSMMGDYALSRNGREVNPLYKGTGGRFSAGRYFAINTPILFGTEILKYKWPKQMRQLQFGFIAGHGIGIGVTLSLK